MRLVFAIVTFVVAAVLLAFGIGVRSAPEPTPDYDFAVESVGLAPLTVVDGTTLNAIEGRQTLTVTGEGPIVAAYARRSDAMAWVGDATYNEIAFRDVAGNSCVPDPDDPGACSLKSISHAGSEASVPDPYDADLWLEDFRDQDRLEMTETLSSDLTFVLASDGTNPAPSSIELAWPTPPPVSRDVSAWLIIAGAVFGVIGLVLLLTAIHRMRTRGGPRRRMPKVPKRPMIKTVRSPKAAARAGAAVALIAATAVVLAPVAQPASAAETPTPTPTAGTGEENAAIPALDERQARRIVSRAIATVTSADATNDSALVAERVSGPALELKLADYALRSMDGTQEPSSPVIPADGELALSLPQQVPVDEATWPRTLFAVVAQPQALEGGDSPKPTATPTPTVTPDSTDPAAVEEPTVLPPVALVLMQDDPRSPYKIVYLVALQADIPEVPATEDGTALLSPSSPLVAHAPESITPAYVDILVNDSTSGWYSDFDIADDRFVLGWGLAKQQEQQANQAAQESPNNMAFSTSAGTGPLIALATTEGGAIVTGTVRQSADVTPAEAGAKVIAQGDIHLLSGVERSERGYTSVYAGQLLFYVPPLDSDAPIVVLGYAGGIVSSAERP